MIHIAESEWLIMQVLWKKSPLTSRQIIEEIAKKTDWNSKTIHTFIQRLCKKGAILKTGEAPHYLYSPAVSEKECAMEETQHFLNRIYHGSLKKLVSTFVESEEISADEIGELKDFLEKLEKERRNG